MLSAATDLPDLLYNTIETGSQQYNIIGEPVSYIHAGKHANSRPFTRAYVVIPSPFLCQEVIYCYTQTFF